MQKNRPARDHLKLASALGRMDLSSSELCINNWSLYTHSNDPSKGWFPVCLSPDAGHWGCLQFGAFEDRADGKIPAWSREGRSRWTVLTSMLRKYLEVEVPGHVLSVRLTV